MSKRTSRIVHKGAPPKSVMVRVTATDRDPDVREWIWRRPYVAAARIRELIRAEIAAEARANPGRTEQPVVPAVSTAPTRPAVPPVPVRTPAAATPPVHGQGGGLQQQFSDIMKGAKKLS